ncbi:MAG: DUF4954 family protein [Sedimentisphaerales bacterium]|nr:DUF4954 family protein [Sedimentisphaerales bacterium]
MTSESIWQEGKYHSLSPEQITALQKQGCTCGDWSKVCVTADFNTDNVHSTHFSGRIRMGAFAKNVSFFGGITIPAGISDATLHNCIIGDNVFISHIKNCIANYTIEEDAVIDNIDLLAVEGESSFGNGIEVAAVNEAGGREIPIYDRLSAHTAYIMAFYRHRPQVIKKLQKMISDYARSVTSSMGLVGKGASIINCRILKNVKIGPAAKIECTASLENGSINSCPEDPVYIGPGVFAEDFIVSSGAKISDGTMISKCFIGQSTELSKEYSAENSVFFANCGGFHGEACAIFAGPYTVTHHKSTLLIAGLFSFLNAGSGTNQSNHMYKLGPVHQGVVERGSKTGSDSYILWPAKVGAFTVVMGRHYRNSDTSDLPFSYLIEHEDESILVPGINLRSVGTVRDARKWPNRDKRKNPDKLDMINFKLLSPYTIQKMLNGRDLLKKLKATSGETSDYYTYHSVKIEKSSLEHGISLYEIGIYKFIGNCLIHRLQNRQISNVNELRDALKPQSDVGAGKWFDMAGLFAPEELIEIMLNDIENDVLNSLVQVEKTFISIHENYPVYEWTWAADVMQKMAGKKIEEITPGDIIELTIKWKNAVIGLDNQLYIDAGKEFAALAQTGFGIDGDTETKHADFAAVRGTFEKDRFVSEIENHIKTKTELANDLINRMNKIE